MHRVAILLLLLTTPALGAQGHGRDQFEFKSSINVYYQAYRSVYGLKDGACFLFHQGCMEYDEDAPGLCARPWHTYDSERAADAECVESIYVIGPYGGCWRLGLWHYEVVCAFDNHVGWSWAPTPADMRFCIQQWEDVER